MIKYLTIQEIVSINEYVIEEYSPNEIKGVKDFSLLDSAVNRPKQSLFGEDAYVTVFDKAAVLLESLSKNHPFHNANKRTAFFSCYLFLYNNGYELNMTPKFAENLVVKFVKGNYDYSVMSEILEDASVKIDNRDSNFFDNI